MIVPITSLFAAFCQIDDPRKARGVRHPYSSILTLTFLGLLCRQTDMAGLQRWAKDHWKTLTDRCAKNVKLVAVRSRDGNDPSHPP